MSFAVRVDVEMVSRFTEKPFSSSSFFISLTLLLSVLISSISAFPAVITMSTFFARLMPDLDSGASLVTSTTESVLPRSLVSDQ